MGHKVISHAQNDEDSDPRDKSPIDVFSYMKKNSDTSWTTADPCSLYKQTSSEPISQYKMLKETNDYFQ